MALNILGKGTKSQIIQILSQKWPLSAKEIHNTLKREYSFEGSYQGVHKALQEMRSEEVLEKKSADFKLSSDWIKKLTEYSKKLEKSVHNKNSETTLTFNTFIECGKFLVMEFIGNKSGKFPNPENKDCICAWNHAWLIVGADDEAHEIMKREFKKTTHYAICANRTFLDKMTQEYTKKNGKKTAFSNKFSAKIDTFVQGDYLFQAYFPKEMIEEMEALYTKVKNEKNLDMNEMFEFSSKKREIKVYLFKNQELADILRKEAKLIYEEAGEK